MGKFTPGRFGNAAVNTVNGRLDLNLSTATQSFSTNASAQHTLAEFGEEGMVLIDVFRVFPNPAIAAETFLLPDPANYPAGTTYILKCLDWSAASSENPAFVTTFIGGGTYWLDDDSLTGRPTTTGFIRDPRPAVRIVSNGDNLWYVINR